MFGIRDGQKVPPTVQELARFLTKKNVLSRNIKSLS